MCKALVRRGVEVILLAPNVEIMGGWLATRPRQLLDVRVGRLAREEGIEIRFFETQWPHKYLVSMDLVRQLNELLPTIDVVHIHSVYRFTTIATARYARKFGVPYIIRPHGTYDDYLMRGRRVPKTIYHFMLEKYYLDRASAIHFTSESELSQARKLRIRSRGAVVPLGLDSPNYLGDKERFLAKHPVLQEKRLIVFLGRITRKKGLDLLVDAFATLAAASSDLQLVIAGPDDSGFRNTIERQIRDRGIAARTTWLGMVSGREKWDLLAAANVWVLPSYTENFGLAVVEALAAGAPVVISDQVAIHDLLSQANAAVVVECNADQLATAMGHVLDDADLRNSLIRNGPRTVAASFSWDAAASKLLKLYRQVVVESNANKRSHGHTQSGSRS